MQRPKKPHWGRNVLHTEETKERSASFPQASGRRTCHAFSIGGGPDLGVSELGGRQVQRVPSQGVSARRLDCIAEPPLTRVWMHAGVLRRARPALWHTPKVLEKEVSHAEFSHTQHTGQEETKRHRLSPAEITRRAVCSWGTAAAALTIGGFFWLESSESSDQLAEGFQMGPSGRAEKRTVLSNYPAFTRQI